MATNLSPVFFDAAPAVIMTSLDLVDFINSERGESEATLAHSDFLKKVPQVLGSCAGFFAATYQVPGPNGGFRSAPSYNFPKREACLMAMSYSYELQAKVFDRMTALEEQAAPARAPALTPATEQAAIAMLVAESTARMLRLQGSSLLGYMGRVTECIAPQIAGALPNYAVNEPAGQSTTGSSEPTFSLTTLLKKNGVAVTAAVMNKRLQAAGIIERMTRPSSKGGAKAFWAITEKGLAYGRNLCSPKNEREVAPAFYASRFDALLAQVG